MVLHAHVLWCSVIRSGRNGVLFSLLQVSPKTRCINKFIISRLSSFIYICLDINPLLQSLLSYLILSILIQPLPAYFKSSVQRPGGLPTLRLHDRVLCSKPSAVSESDQCTVTNFETIPSVVTSSIPPTSLSHRFVYGDVEYKQVKKTSLAHCVYRQMMNICNLH